MELHEVSAREIDAVTDLIEAGLGLGLTMGQAVAQALVTQYGSHEQFRRESPTWRQQRPRIAAGVST